MNLLLNLFLCFLNQQDDPVWEKVSESDGIETKIGTDSHTEFPIFESTVTIPSNIHLVYEKLMDHNNLKSLVYGVSDSKRLEDQDDRTIVYYQLDLPWPVRDKYAITEEFAYKSERRIDILIKSIEHEYKPADNLSKIDMLLTNWELYQLGDNSTKVVYRSTADPMGIPNWIVKLFLSTSPKETLKNLRDSVAPQATE